MLSQPLTVPLGSVPPQLAAALRPELASLCDEILREVCSAVPAYSRAARGEYAEAVRSTIDYAVRAFVETIADPAACTADRDEMCRTIGRLQVHFDVGLNHLDTAFRVGVRVLWRRTVAVCRQHDLSAAVQSSAADLLFGYVDELAGQAREGFLDARSNAAAHLVDKRRRLVADLLGGRAAPSAIERGALEARWPLPERITVVVPESGAHVDAALLASHVLVGEGRGRPVLLVPGDPSPGDIAALRIALGGVTLIVGPAVPVTAVHHSLRWTTRALTLAEDGALGAAAQDVTLVDDHLLAIWLSSDSALARHIVDARLGALTSMTPTQRARTTDTLYWWLVHNGNAALMAEELGIHPQTARYRVRGLETAFGPALEDPQWRISTEIALRALRLRQERGAAPARSRAG